MRLLSLVDEEACSQTIPNLTQPSREQPKHYYSEDLEDYGVTAVFEEERIRSNITERLKGCFLVPFQRYQWQGEHSLVYASSNTTLRIHIKINRGSQLREI